MTDESLSLSSAGLESDWRVKERGELAPEEVRTIVGTREVCMRVVTELGLYDTVAGRAVVVEVEIGG